MRPAKASPFGRGVTEGDGEGKPGRKELLRSDGQALCQSDTIAVQELLGPRPAGCERQRSRRWEPQPGQWQRVSADGEVELLSQRESLCLRGLREFVENARQKREEFVKVIKMPRRY